MDGSGFERVYTVNEYYDGPRLGVADFGGRPHVYRSVYLDYQEWNASEDRFELSPISPDALAVVLEAWAIWERFELALRAGRIPHPETDADWGALPNETARRLELEPRVQAALTIDPGARTVAHGEFRAREPVPDLPPGVLRPLEVEWRPVE